MEEKKIRDLLKRYGADDNEIENFMEDLADTKEDIEDLEHDIKKDNIDEPVDEDDIDDEKYLFNVNNLKVLKATEEGKDLIMKAPTMKKEELEKAIKDYLQRQK